MNKVMMAIACGVMLTGAFAVPAAADENPGQTEVASGDAEETPEATSVTLYDLVNYRGDSFPIVNAQPQCYNLPPWFERRTESVGVSPNNVIGLCRARDCRDCLVISGSRSTLGQSGYANAVVSVQIY